MFVAHCVAILVGSTVGFLAAMGLVHLYELLKRD